MQLGIYTFVDVHVDPATGKQVDVHQRIKDLMEEIRLADEVGLDVFAIGEHHRPDYAISSPEMILAAAAATTKNIRLSSGVTVLSSDDPVRVFQRFATVDLLSGGRAEIMAGRGSFIESFPLFGYDLKDYDELFSEKLELLVKLNESERINWTGKHRAAITTQSGIYPRPYQEKLPIWVAVGGTPESVVRAARLGLNINIAIIGGQPAQFQRLVKLYRDTAAQYGHTGLEVGIGSHGLVGDTAAQARDDYFPHYTDVMSRIGRERGWGPMSRAQYHALTTPQGALLTGDPQEVIDKILYEHSLFQNTRFLLQMDTGVVPHDKLMRSIELFGTHVAPAVRKAVAS
jgi:probable LLM family oxidoreductase